MLTGSSRFTARRCLFAVLLTLSAAGVAVAQLDEELQTQAAVEAADKWRTAMQALQADDPEIAEIAFGDLVAADVAPLRLAMMADRMVARGQLGGAVLLFKQEYANEALRESGMTVGERLAEGEERLKELNDAFFYASVGRFGIANANFEALLDANVDPVATLEYVSEDARRADLLIRITDNPIVGESAQQMLDLLFKGEQLVKADPLRITSNIERLARGPRAFQNALAALRESGEYAVPFLIMALSDPEQEELVRPIVRALPQIGRGALNPLVMALQSEDHAIKRFAVDALGELGYFQAVPYLLKLREQPGTSEDLREHIDTALQKLRSAGTPVNMAPAEAFYRLAEAYYNEREDLAADPRLEQANVWYWRQNVLVNVPVPTEIFNEVMCMRSCEEALNLNPELRDALALWVAANFRRVAQLEGGEDRTRPDDFGTAEYYARSAGSDYCQMVLERAVNDGDPAVALGAILALRDTAGPATMIQTRGTPPLGRALTFPDRMVRIRAALALANADPRQDFPEAQNLMPVLVEALGLSRGARSALVVEPNQALANTLATMLRDAGYSVLIDTNLLTGLQKVRDQAYGVDLIVIGSDIRDPQLEPGLEQVRSEFTFASTPTVIVTKGGDRDLVTSLTRGDHRLAGVPRQVNADTLLETVNRLTEAVGIQTITRETGLNLAIEAADAIRRLSVRRNPVFDVTRAEPALIRALGSGDPVLKVAAAGALAQLESQASQSEILRAALDPTHDQRLRVQMFEAVAESGKLHGVLAEDALVQRLIDFVMGEANMELRTAASQALGALNLPSDPASEIIRDVHQG